jgi:hypothetical protein
VGSLDVQRAAFAATIVVRVAYVAVTAGYCSWPGHMIAPKVRLTEVGPFAGTVRTLVGEDCKRETTTMAAKEHTTSVAARLVARRRRYRRLL